MLGPDRGLTRFSGTLVIAIPTAQGLILAADSRITGRSGFSYETHKIRLPIRSQATAVAVTGLLDLLPVYDGDAAGVANYVKNAERALNVADVVQNLLDPSAPLNEDFIRALAANCCDAISALPVANYLKEDAAGSVLCVVVLGSYEPKLEKCIIANFTIMVDGAIRPGPMRWKTYGTGDEVTIQAFGAADYMVQHVFNINGPGQKFLGPAKRYFEKYLPVSELTCDEATEWAVDLIDATAKTMKILPGQTTKTSPDPHYVGGPVDVVLLGNDPEPRKMRWRSTGHAEEL